MEARGTGPLLFHLKCIEKDNELAILLEREIEARRFFMLCLSVPASIYTRKIV